jgi:hypothetical protein
MSGHRRQVAQIEPLFSRHQGSRTVIGKHAAHLLFQHCGRFEFPEWPYRAVDRLEYYSEKKDNRLASSDR